MKYMVYNNTATIKFFSTHVVACFLGDFFTERHAVGEAVDTLALLTAIVPFSVIL